MEVKIAGSEVVTPIVAGSDTPDDSNQTVKYATFQKLLDQKKAQDTRLAEQAIKLAEFEAAEAAKKEQALRDEKKHDEIIANLKLETTQLNGKLAKVQTDIQESIKRQALETMIGGFAHASYSSFAQLDKIALLEDGTVDQESLTLEAKRLKESHPNLLKTPATPLPSGAPRAAGTPEIKPPVVVSWGDAAKAFMTQKGK